MIAQKVNFVNMSEMLFTVYLQLQRNVGDMCQRSVGDNSCKMSEINLNNSDET